MVVNAKQVIIDFQALQQKRWDDSWSLHYTQIISQLKNSVAIYTVFDRLSLDPDLQVNKLIKNMVAILTT